MRTINKLLTTVVGAALLLTACNTKDPIYDTEHPGKAQITVTADWSGIGQGITKPAEYFAAYGTEELKATQDTYTFPNLLDPGTYTVYFYNKPGEISITGSQAAVTQATAPEGRTGTFIHPTPGWLFTARLHETVEADKDYAFTVPMRQQVSEITFTVTPTGGTTDKIESITGTLGGVAGAMNLDNGARSAASSVAMTFAKQSDGKWKATVRLLGIVGDAQPLTTIVKFTGGNPGDVTDTTDIHDEIDDGFGNDGGPTDPGSGGTQPDIDLGTEIVETPTGTGFTATIKPWEKITGTGTAD